MNTKQFRFLVIQLLREILAEVRDIKAKTDNLPVDPASQSQVEAKIVSYTARKG